MSGRSRSAKSTEFGLQTIGFEMEVVDDDFAFDLNRTTIEFFKGFHDNDWSFNCLVVGSFALANAEDSQLLMTRFHHLSPFRASSLFRSKDQFLDKKNNHKSNKLTQMGTVTFSP